MKKADLKSGMVIEVRSGDRYLVLRDNKKLTFMNANCKSYIDSRNLGKDMLRLTYNNLDIMRVFDKVSILNDVQNTTCLLWERKEVKKMTLAEIENELGYKVEVIAG